jgi:hypothetical protein
MAHGAHGCFVDYQGYVWVAGNGDDIVQKYKPMAANAEGASATYVAQIGTKGTCDTLTPPALLHVEPTGLPTPTPVTRC